MKLAPLLAALVTVATAGCSSRHREPRQEPVAAAEPAVQAKPEEAPAPTPQPAVVVTFDAGSSGVPLDFPPACLAYASLIDRLAACDKVGGAREAMTRAYEDLRSAWSMVPADQRAAIDTQCQTQADSLRNAAAATCGW